MLRAAEAPAFLRLVAGATDRIVVDLDRLVNDVLKIDIGALRAFGPRQLTSRPYTAGIDPATILDVTLRFRTDSTRHAKARALHRRGPAEAGTASMVPIVRLGYIWCVITAEQPYELFRDARSRSNSLCSGPLIRDHTDKISAGGC